MAVLTELNTLTLRFQSAALSELLEMRSAAALFAVFGPDVRSLRISMGSFTDDRSYFTLRAGLKYVDYFSINWDALFVLLPSLRRLDLSKMPLSSLHVKKILEVAGEHCAELEALVLPRHTCRLEVKEQVDPLMHTLFEVLKKWGAREERPGLRQLSVPVLAKDDWRRSSTELVGAIAACCLNLEFLDGSHQSLGASMKIASNDQRDAALSAWQRFNISCTQIKELHWVVATLDDPFFEAFGRHVKPQFTKLSLVVCMRWNREEYFKAGEEAWAGSSTICKKKAGSRSNTFDAGAAFKACLNLTTLEVVMHHQVINVVSAAPERRREGLRWTAVCPNVELLNPELLHDSFCEDVAASCLLLERFTVREGEEKYNKSSIEPVQTVTDRSLVALSALPQLSTLHLRSVNVTGDGIFEFLNGLSPGFTGLRTFDMAVGGNTSRMSFYYAFVCLMERIERTDLANLRFAYCKFVLRVRNVGVPNDWAVDGAWSAQYLKRAASLVERVKAKHPSLRVRVTMRGLRGCQFANAFDFGLYSFATWLKWNDWDADNPERNIAFANRGGASRCQVESEHCGIVSSLRPG